MKQAYSMIKNIIYSFLYLFLFYFLVIHSSVATPDNASIIRWQINGFDQPESALYDKKRQQVIVSNINGSAMDKNGLGYLSRLSPAGKILEKKWITGLDAPKGMAILGDILFIADIQQLHLVDLTKNERIDTFHIPQSQLLNDVTAGKGKVWITDFLGHTIWQYHQGRISQFFYSDYLSHPNGIHQTGTDLLLASWGSELQSDFSTRFKGHLWHLDIKRQQLRKHPNGQKIGNLDGITVLNQTIYSSDWMSGNLLATHPGQKTIILENFGSGLADISQIDTDLLLPHMQKGSVTRLSPP